MTEMLRKIGKLNGTALVSPTTTETVKKIIVENLTSRQVYTKRTSPKPVLPK